MLFILYITQVFLKKEINFELKRTNLIKRNI